MIITIDGPAGSGKSTAARKLAARLGIAYLDTGAMYRAIAYAALQQGTDLGDENALTRLTRDADLELDCGPTHTRVRLNGEDVSEAIRTMGVNQATPYVARVPAVRALLVERQRALARRLGALVTEGRDQGSVVFPDADLRVVLDASLEKRAERRHAEMTTEGDEVSIQEVLENLEIRDRTDQRQWSPLLEPGRAIVIDTTHLTIQQVVDQMADMALSLQSGRKN